MKQIAVILVPVLLMTAGMPVIMKVKCFSQGHKLLGFLMFIIYVLGNMYFTVLSRKPGTVISLELIPFRTYQKLFEPFVESPRYPMGFAQAFLFNTPPIVSFILNILLYYPLGYLLPILFPKLKPKHIILIGCLCSIATEATQYLLKMGWCETDDVIHNTLGTAIGVWVWHLQSKRLNKPKSNELAKD